MNRIQRKLIGVLVIVIITLAAAFFINVELKKHFNNSTNEEGKTVKVEYKSLVESTLDEQSELYLYERNFATIYSEDSNLIDKPKNFISKPFSELTNREFEVELELTFKHGVDVSQAAVSETEKSIIISFSRDSQVDVVIPNVNRDSFRAKRGVMRNVFTEEERSTIVANAIDKANEDVETYKDYDELEENLNTTLKGLLGELVGDKEISISFDQQ